MRRDKEIRRDKYKKQKNMLRRLTIRNYALIENLELEFGPGLTIITGETGAGKSIMLGALSLLMGGRADSKVISDGSGKSVVEASFSSESSELKSLFEKLDLEWNSEEIIIRREIASTGRSRVFINDMPVTLSSLQTISSRLIDIHSQHENTRLVNPAAQLEIIDSVSDNAEIRERYSAAFSKFVEVRNRVKSLREEIERNRENREYLNFQYEGLAELKPKKGELEAVERRFELLSDADEIMEKLRMFRSLLGENETGAIDLVRSARSESEKIDFSLVGITDEPDVPNIKTRLENVIIELQDIFDTVDDAASTIDSDPRALEKLSARMNEYYEAMKRYRVKNADELADLKERLELQIASIDSDNEELPSLEREGKQLAAQLKEIGRELSESRLRGAEKFSGQITRAARPLGLHNLEFKVKVESGKIGPTGQDKIEFLCSFNKNQTPSVLSGMASGGEMSRLMLTIKGLLADRMNLPTIIFDEVDTGVSGEIADKMGEMMLAMSGSMQVMAITHLPQVAAKGDSHLKVYKRDKGERTVTHVMPLSGESRIREIAAMMSGSEVGEAALDNARTLMGIKR